MISIIITAYNEASTIGKAIDAILDPKNNNIPQDNWELILVCPDEETRITAESIVKKYNHFDKFVRIKDPQKGKPTALNMAFKEAKGDILILTDGDVYIKENSIAPLLNKFNESQNIAAVTGRPVSSDSKNNLFGYWGHLLSDAANHKRTVTLTTNKGNLSKRILHEQDFFVMSGYLCAIKKPNFEIPVSTLSDDAYISYQISQKGFKIAYSPDSIVYIKYPTNLKDWYDQKTRSLGGFTQLWQMGVVNKNTQTRSFRKELQYFWYPIKYATNLKEFFWSLLLYPVRLFLWIKIYIDRKVLNKSFEESWVRIESTK